MAGAYGILFGIDPYVFIDEDDEHYLIKLAMLTKARKLRDEEHDNLIKRLAAELAVAVGLATFK